MKNILIVIAIIFVFIVIVNFSLNNFNHLYSVVNIKPTPKSNSVSVIPTSIPSPTPVDQVLLDQPTNNQVVTSPLIVKGKARGGWFFEGAFPVRLEDEKGNVISQASARALGEWMTEEFVSFEVSLIFSKPNTSKGNLILEKDNPSGLPENAKQIQIPIRFTNL